MSAGGSMLSGLIGAVMFLLGAFAFSQRNWKAGCGWWLAGVVLVAVLSYLDKPSSGVGVLGGIK